MAAAQSRAKQTKRFPKNNEIIFFNKNYVGVYQILYNVSDLDLYMELIVTISGLCIYLWAHLKLLHWISNNASCLW